MVDATCDVLIVGGGPAGSTCARQLSLAGRNVQLIDKMEFQFQTNIAVVDVEGGERLTKDMSSPGRVLLMDPAGRLYIREELDDKEDVDLHDSIFAEDPTQRGRGTGRDFEGGGFDYGGEGFEFGF